MPNLIGGLILGFIWQFIFVNVFNAVGQSLGQEWMMGWLSNSTTGFWGMVIIMAWQMAGYVMVIYIAGLQNVPPELNEAAKIDGCMVFTRDGRMYTGVVLNTEPSAHVADEKVETKSKCMAKNKTYHFPNDKTIIYNKFILNTFELI